MGTGFKQLKVWAEARDLAVEVYRLSSAGPLAKDFGLRDQLRRAAVSIPSNIAEGDERDTDKDAVRFFYIAKGSVAELRTQLEIALHVNLLTSDLVAPLETKSVLIAKMLGALIKARSATFITRP
ncbi:MAG: four helix bundle protein [Verrucomicrobia bacterium]|nr:four helix bundle protein [Verrucomicrobiota bacterium]